MAIVNQFTLGGPSPEIIAHCVSVSALAAVCLLGILSMLRRSEATFKSEHGMELEVVVKANKAQVIQTLTQLVVAYAEHAIATNGRFVIGASRRRRACSVPASLPVET